MADADRIITYAVRPLTRYSLRIVPLWDGDAECFALDGSLREIVETIMREKSVTRLIGGDVRPMRFCVIEEEEAIEVPALGKTFHAREHTPVWKVMVPAAGVYSRETILSCLTRSAGRNTEKYGNALFRHPGAAEFYTFSKDEIRPVDDTVFVIEHPSR